MGSGTDWKTVATHRLAWSERKNRDVVIGLRIDAGAFWPEGLGEAGESPTRYRGQIMGPGMARYLGCLGLFLTKTLTFLGVGARITKCFTDKVMKRPVGVARAKRAGDGASPVPMLS